MGNYIQIKIPITTTEQSGIFIALLSEIDFYSFEEEADSLSAFIKEADFNEVELKSILPENTPYSKVVIPDTNWNAKWESEFEPIVVEDFVAVRAAFHLPVAGVQHDIIITPRMSFGTGHHATTWLMLQQMGTLDFTGKRVLDFGTGTGILAILAHKLGAAAVTAVDNDEWSIRNARGNFEENDCSGITLMQKEDLAGLKTFDIILANINLNVITGQAGNLQRIINPSSTIVLSGFLHQDEEKVKDVFNAAGFTPLQTVVRNEWIAMLLIKS